MVQALSYLASNTKLGSASDSVNIVASGNSFVITDGTHSSSIPAGTDVGSGGATVYANSQAFPLTGLNAGDFAFASNNNTLYMTNGSGWYKIALVNQNPSITLSATSVTTEPGSNTANVTYTVTEPENTPTTITISYDFTSNANIVHDSSNTNISITNTDANTYTGNVTVTVSDGINTGVGTISLTNTVVTAIENSIYTSLLAKASGNNGENTSITDGSSTNHTITLNGSPTVQSFSPYRAGGYSLSFDGTGDYLSIPTDTSLELGSSNYTIECWFYLTASSVASDGLISMGQSGSTSTFASLQFDSSRKINWFISQYSAVSPVVQSPVIQMNTWYHVAVTRNGNDHAMYLNGISVDTQTTSYTNTIGNVFYIGCGWYATNRTFYGYIADARLVKGTAVYTSDFTPPSERLTAITNTSLLACHLPYFADGSSNSHTITVNGDTKVEAFGPYDYEPYSASKHGSSVYFDGSGDYLSIPDHSSLEFGSGDFTVEFWYKGSDTDQYATLTTKGSVINGASTGNWIIIMNQYVTGDISVYVADYSLSSPILNTGAVGVSNDNWHHIAFVRNGTSFNLYVDGVSKAVTTSSLTFGNNASNVIIGKDLYYGRDLSGFISDYRIVKGTAVYTSNFTPPTAPLTAVTNTSLLTCNDAPDIYDASGSTRVALYGVTSANLNTKYTSNMVLDGGAEYVFFHPETGSYHNDVTGDFTVETWIRLNSNTIAYPYLWIIRDLANTSGPRIIARFGDSGFGYHLQFELNGTGYEAVHSVNLTQSNFNTYRHVALTRSNGIVKCFVDGTQYSFGTGADPSSFPNSTISFSNSITNIDQLYIGYEVDGQMEDFRFTNGLARYPFIPLRETLTADADTKFLTGHASTITDGSDDNHTITVSGAIASGFGPRPGMNSISFDGSNDYLRCDAALDWDEGPGHNFTIEGWAYFNTIGSVFEALVGINKASNGNNHLILGATSGDGFVIYWDAGSATPIGVTVNTKKWYHWAVVYTGVRIEVYINGSHVHSVTDTTGTRLQDCTLLIGAEADSANAGTIGNFQDGYISNFRISAGIRYTPDFTPPTAELEG